MPFSGKGILTHPLVASNCAYHIDWPEVFLDKNEGKAIKNIVISCNEGTQKGEVVVTRQGIEGNAIYALSDQIQKELTNGRQAKIEVDLKKQLSEIEVFNKLFNSSLNTTTTLKKILNLSGVQIDLLRVMLTKKEFVNKKVLAKRIKRFPLFINASGPIDQAISTTGGIALTALTNNFELKHLKAHYCIGEMLDWNAPTGGYLIQGCASMGVSLARVLNSKKCT